MVKIEHINLKKDKKDLLKIFNIVFPDTANNFNEQYIIPVSDIDISIKLTDNDKIIGFYMFKKLNYEYTKYFYSILKNEYNIDKEFLNFKGLEGVALGIHPDYKSKGYGKMLINYPYKVLSKNYDYITGQHFEHLKNIQHWLKQRILLIPANKNKGINITFGFLKTEYDYMLKKLNKNFKLKIFENFNFKRDIKHIFQPTGHSCGNTAIKMIYDKRFPDNDISVENLIDFCETDWIKGTPPERMILGFEKIGMDYKEKSGFNELKKSLNNGKYAIVRTVTQNVPHWIVIDYYDNNTDTFYILDSWLGKITYNTNELEDIWKVRNYFYFEV